MRFRRSNAMEGTAYFLLLACALAALPLASAQASQVPRQQQLVPLEPPQAGDQYASDVGRAIARYFCLDLRDGSRCRIQQAWDSRLQGVCCSGVCAFGAVKCVPGEQARPQYDLYGMFEKFACNGVQEGQDCSIPEKLSAVTGYRLSGKCCRGRCRLGFTDCGSFCGDGLCTDGEMADGNCMEDCGGGGQPPDLGGTDIEGRLKDMEALACLGVRDEQACNLPKELENTFRLTGVCCGGRCAYRKTQCEKLPVAAKPDLVVTAINVNPKLYGVDEPVNVTVEVKNVGEGLVNASFWVRLRVEDRSGRDVADFDREVNGSTASGTRTEPLFQEVSCPADANPCTLKADVDQGSGRMPARMDLVDETNEENNFAAVGFNAREKPRGPACGDGICSDGERCDLDCAGDTPADNTRNIAIAAAALLTLALAAYLLLRMRNAKPQARKAVEDSSVEELMRQKDEIEKMLDIAKAKYHRRELDEESFREIVRDNQKRIIELELKIRVNRPFD